MTFRETLTNLAGKIALPVCVGLTALTGCDDAVGTLDGQRVVKNAFQRICSGGTCKGYILFTGDKRSGKIGDISFYFDASKKLKKVCLKYNERFFSDCFTQGPIFEDAQIKAEEIRSHFLTSQEESALRAMNMEVD
jgi:hypothetical protein